MEKNKHFEECEIILKEIKNRLINETCGLSIHGSAVYGKKYINPNENYKPHEDSDLDFMIISEDLNFLNCLDDLLEKNELDLKSFQNNYLDIIVFRGKFYNRKLSFECVKGRKYDELCDASQPFIIVNKKLKTSKQKVGNFYDYAIHGFSRTEIKTSRIIPHEKSHLIVYPNLDQLSNGSFALTVFQDQIITQIDLIKNEQTKYRRKLVHKIREKAKIYNKDPLLLFKEHSIFWSDEFKEQMRYRIYD